MQWGSYAMNIRVVMAIVCAASFVTAATVDVQCVGIKGHALLLVSGGRTGTFRLAGVVLPGTTPTEQHLFATLCCVQDFVVRGFLTNVAEALSSSANQPLKITDTVGRDVWLEHADGQSVNCALVAKGIATVCPAPPAKYRKVLVEALRTAVTEHAGIWSLPTHHGASSCLHFKCTAHTADNSAAKAKQNYSSFSASANLISQVRVIELVIDAKSVKRPMVLGVKYQFKLVTFSGGNAQDEGVRSLSAVKSMAVTMLPGETRTIKCTSDEATMVRRLGADGAASSYQQGTSFEGEMISVSHDGREIFAQGKIKEEASDDDSDTDEDTSFTRRSY